VSANKQAASLGPHDADTLPRNLQLLISREQVEERAGIDNVDLSMKLLERALEVKYIGCDELALESITVAEQFITQIDQVEQKIRSVALPTIDAIGDQTAEILCKCTAEIEEGFAARFHAFQDLRVKLVIPYGKLQETALANAWVGMDGEGFVALLRASD
jgi:hypothetical protein